MNFWIGASKIDTFFLYSSTWETFCSNLVTVPPGPHLLSDILVSSAIVAGEDGSAPAYVSSGGGSYEFGVDPNLDPELALAIRISLEEERARQESASGASAAAEGGAPAATATAGDSAMSIEDDLLAQALASSQADVSQDPDQSFRTFFFGPRLLLIKISKISKIQGDHDMEGLTEEQEMQRAIQMSMGGGSDHDGAGASTEEAMNDPDFMNSVLGSLSGVDTTDPRIQNVLQGFSSASNNSSKEEEDKKKKEEEEKKE